MGKLLIANIRGPKGDTGGPANVLTDFYGTLDPTGAVASDLAIANWVDDCASNENPGYVPPGTYKITSQMNWQVPGLQLAGAGSKFTRFRQATANTGVAAVAGSSQKISGIDLGYSSQEVAAHTAAIGLALGDDTVGSSFMSIFEDLLFTQCQRGIAVNPSVATAAGLFSCEFRSMRVLGYSQNAIDLAGNNGGGLANCTGVVFNNTYIHNNYSGSAAQSANYPVFLESWDEIIFNQLNIEHGESFNWDIIGLSGVGSCIINDLHIESMQLSGSDGKAAYISLANSGVSVRGMTIRYGTMSGTTENAVVRFASSTTSKSTASIEGFDEGSECTFSHAHPWVDFGGKNNCSLVVRNIVNSKTDSTAVNAGTGCYARIESADVPSAKPTAALAETFSRDVPLTGSNTGSSGTVYGRLIPLKAGQLISSITFFTSSNVKTGGTHGWYALLDGSGNVYAVSADQTDASTFLGTALTKYTLNVTVPYTVPADVDYYIAECVVESGGSMPNFLALTTQPTVIDSQPPIRCGTFGTGKTTPPTVGSALSAISALAGYDLYGYVS